MPWISQARGKRRFKTQGTPLADQHYPNDPRRADYKGEFMLADKRYCYPLTITDFSSRYPLACERCESNNEKNAFCVFGHVFRKYGLPKTIRTDNGVPFSSAHALFGLSKLSVWWLRLGFRIERVKPGNPRQKRQT